MTVSGSFAEPQVGYFFASDLVKVVFRLRGDSSFNSSR